MKSGSAAEALDQSVFTPLVFVFMEFMLGLSTGRRCSVHRRVKTRLRSIRSQKHMEAFMVMFTERNVLVAHAGALDRENKTEVLRVSFLLRTVLHLKYCM